MTELMFPKKNVAFDATMLSSIMGCARMTDLRFNHSLIPSAGKSNSLEVGSIIHKYLEYYYESIIKGFTKQLSHNNGMAAAELYIRGCEYCKDFVSSEAQPKPSCGHPPNEFEGVINTPADDEGYKTGWKFALDTCEQYFTHYANDYWVPLEVEKVKSKILYQDDEIRVLWKAKLDVVMDTNQGIYPVDHKTQKQRRDTIKTNNQFIGQCLIMDTRSAIKNNIGLQKSLKPVDKFTREMVSYSADILLEWQSTILPYWAYQYISWVESGYWPPNYANCETKFGKCQYLKDVCEADRTMREENLRLHFIKAPEWNPTNEE